MTKGSIIAARKRKERRIRNILAIVQRIGIVILLIGILGIFAIAGSIDAEVYSIGGRAVSDTNWTLKMFKEIIILGIGFMMYYIPGYILD